MAVCADNCRSALIRQTRATLLTGTSKKSLPRRIAVTQSREDALDIWAYVARDNPRAATKLLRLFDETLRRLAESPGIGAAQDKYRAGLRSFPIGNYVLFYEAIAEGIRVIRILHAARNWPDLL